MRNKYVYFLLICVMTTLMFLTMNQGGGTVRTVFSQDIKPTDLPIVDYELATAKSESKARREKNSHFKGAGNPDSKKPIVELPLGVEPLPTNGHWWIGLSALPVQQSDCVVRGRILNREAHLADDRTGIYSEFAVQIEQVFKDSAGSLIVGNSLSVNRVGGSVRFQSGRIQEYQIARQGMPSSGGEYVLFLKKTTDGDFVIVTGYELVDGKVVPLDGANTTDPRSDLPFSQYRGAKQEALLKDLQQATSKSIAGGVR